MQRFHSPATRLLGLARQRLRLRELLLARARAGESALDRRCAAARTELHAAEQTLALSLAAVSDAAGLSAQQSHVAVSVERLAKLTSALTEARGQAAACLAELQRERGKARSLELLEAKHVQFHRRDAARWEEAERDERRAARGRCTSESLQEVTHG